MKLLRKLLFTITMFLSVFSVSFSQNETINFSKPQSSFWNNVRFGGGLGLSFNNGFFSGSIAPSAIYQFDPQFALGTGLNVTYNSLRDSYQSTILGASIILLYNVIPQIQLSSEWEQLYVSRNFENNLENEDDAYWYPAVFLGAGFTSQMVTFGIRYDVLYDENQSIYANAWVPFVRVFF